MTTKPHSNEEVIEEFYKKCEYERGEQSSTYTDRCANFIRTLLAQKDKDIEICEAIIAVASENAETLAELSDEIMAGNIRRNIVNVLTPSDQTANPTN